MDNNPTSELRELAALITSAYTQANPVPLEVLPVVLRQAYQGLDACLHPPAPPPPAAPVRRGRGRPRKQR